MESISVILIAFLERRTWQQAELARRVGIERKTLVKLLTGLERAIPLTRDEEPPQVYWSVPNNWFPGGVAFQGQAVVELVRLFQRAPRSEKRDRILLQISKCVPDLQSMIRPDVILTQALSVEEETLLSVLQESVEQSCALRVQYYTLSRGDLAWRYLSAHRILVESGRVIATCHREGKLKWFRVSGILSAHLATQEGFRSRGDTDIQDYLDQSVDGYHSGESPLRCIFRVRLPEARGLLAQRLVPLTAVEREGVIIFTAVTAALLPLARLLVGLGGAVTVDTPRLRLLVTELAQAALQANQ